MIREYEELKFRVLTMHGCSRWEKVDSLQTFPKMGANERSSVVLFRLNTLKPATLELYLAIFRQILPYITGSPVQPENDRGIGQSC
jgi:hypothetical protein